VNRSLVVRISLAAALLGAGAAIAKDGIKPAAAGDAPVQALAIGSPAPMRGVKMKSVDGSEVSIEKVAGKNGTLVVFTCNHCPWAKMWQTRVASIGNAALEQGIGVIAINANDPAEYPEDEFAPMQERAKMLGFKFPYAVDATSGIAKAFGATRTPEAYLFDAKGKLVYHGAIDDNPRDESAVEKAWLHDAVNAVATGGSIETAETKALGCSIKYRSSGKKTS